MLAGTYADRVRRYYHEAFVARNWDYLRDLIAPNAWTVDGIGPDAKIAPLASVLAGLSDISVDIHHLVEGSDQVAVHFVFTATDTGGLLGRPPTGRRFSLWGAEFWRFEGEQVVEDWIGNDWLSAFIQLGVVPSPWPAASSV
jgi:predicted ester cyclase